MCSASLEEHPPCLCTLPINKEVNEVLFNP